MVIVYILLILAAIALLISYLCFRIAFYVPKQVIIGPDEYPIPDGDIYEAHREQMIIWMKQMRALPCRICSITSHDGLYLQSKYYECAPDSPIELMFHGYRGNAERDLCGGIQRAFSLGHSALIVDQRTAGHSEGKVISFGVNESRDCLGWVDYAVREFPNRPIILTGISMGASTVLLAAGHELPKNVVAVLADCGYTSAKEIIKVVIKILKLPPRLCYPFVKLGARIFGHFDLDAADATAALQRCKVPVIFAHGDADDFVPCYMSQKNYDACPTHKKLVIIAGAGHGLCYPVDPEGYVRQLKEFFQPIVG